MPAEIVLGVGASHSTLMNTHWEQTTHRAEAVRFRDGLAAARDLIAAARPDTVLLVGSNHFRGFWLDLIPAFTLGVGECVASGESGTPSGPQPVDIPLARHLTGSLVDAGFDPAFSARLQIDHGQTHAIQYLLDGVDAEIVPLVVNVFAPPLPTLARCLDLGAALRAAILSFPESRRVAVVASGGLSHRLPWPDWREPDGDDEEFMVRAWLNGRGDWASYDERRRSIVRAAPSVITPEFDHDFLALLAEGRAAEATAHTTEDLERIAGNGAQEIRAWLIMAAALGHAPARTLAYAPVPDWLTGMAVAVIDPAEETAR
ncbi:hypothetical protein [Actinocorallia sp. A-T 12471]|uniref:DODA-type extradiol aromatic ring-opening family dioxygenase n=1 Tax=Actinocorallia sp. A-T 12471 TaxID=3089813 RepID=UPI0029CEB1F1|nr:hypothetical protein [Actinocorallia sp. A-T 12471]MDX6742397.1 hypothetical protein [Actinocorallia sp. A-T 12471]